MDRETEAVLADLRAVLLALDDDQGIPPEHPTASAWLRERYTRPDPGPEPDDDD
jgi:hypothetical protein